MNIAHIIPLIRIPMNMGYFDYEIPKDMLCHPGQLVEIPFRSKTILGCIFLIDDTSPHKGKLKPITKLIHEVPFLTKEYLQFAMQVAGVYGVAPSIIVSMMLPAAQKNSLSKAQFTPIPEIANGPSKSEVVRYHNTKDMIVSIQEQVRNIKTQVLILVPQQQQLKLMKSLFKSAVAWESTMSVKEKREAWIAIRNGARVIIGTRSAVFLPIFTCEHIIILDEEKQDHKSWEQAPRYRVHDIAQRLQLITGCSLTYYSRTPTFATIESVTKKNLTQIGERQPSTITLVDMVKERGSGNFDPISAQLETDINENLTEEKSIFLFLNKKGFAQLLRCNDCSHIFSCASCLLPYTLGDNKAICRPCSTAVNVPTHCEKCNGMTLRYQGAGIQQIVHWAHTKFANKAHIIEMTADGDMADIPQGRPSIIVGTTRVLPQLSTIKPGLIAVLDADHILKIPEYNAAERALALFSTMAATAREMEPPATFVIQTHSSAHPSLESLISGKLQPFIKSENDVRQQLSYPPYSKLMKIWLEKPKAEKTMKMLKEVIAKHLPKIQVVLYALLPEQQGKNKRYAVLCKLDSKQWWQQTQVITSLLRPGMKVDIDPNSLLS